MEASLRRLALAGSVVFTGLATAGAGAAPGGCGGHPGNGGPHPSGGFHAPNGNSGTFPSFPRPGGSGNRCYPGGGYGGVCPRAAATPEAGRRGIAARGTPSHPCR